MKSPNVIFLFQLRVEALRLRFQTEVQQLDTVRGVERHLDRLQHAKQMHSERSKNAAMNEFIKVRIN